MEFPQVLVLDEDLSEDEAALALARAVKDIGADAPFVVASPHGARLAAELHGPRAPESPVDNADQSWAADLGSRARRSGADAIVAIGGGRCLDVGKLAAARAGLPVFAVPTLLSHDGICSPVAVVPGDDERAESLGAIAPRVVCVSLPTLLRSPDETVRAGVGDLIANPLALRDWALAAERGLEETNARAWDLSAESFERVRALIEDGAPPRARDAEVLRRLCDALVLSGMAMIVAGSSRPASGAEHEISHAIDHRFRGRALHGAQVAFGCIVSVELYGEDVAAFRAQLGRLGLPDHPRALGLDERTLVELLLEAPDTRPGRFTVLEDADLDEGKARTLVRRIWADL